MLSFSPLSRARRYRGYSILRQRDTRPKRKRVPLLRHESSESFSPLRCSLLSLLSSPSLPPFLFDPHRRRGRPIPTIGDRWLALLLRHRSSLVIELPLPRSSFVSTLQFFSASEKRPTRAGLVEADMRIAHFCEKIPTTYRARTLLSSGPFSLVYINRCIIDVAISNVFFKPSRSQQKYISSINSIYLEKMRWGFVDALSLQLSRISCCNLVPANPFARGFRARFCFMENFPARFSFVETKRVCIIRQASFQQ